MERLRDAQMKPLQPAISLPPHYPSWSSAVIASTGITQEQCRNLYNDEFLAGETWMNDTYVVIMTQILNKVTHLSIRRKDRKPCRDWRDFQQMKTQLCGAEREGVEVYPAESRVIDTANQFHLWVLPLGMSIPVGYFFGRHVTDDLIIPGAVQRPLQVCDHHMMNGEDARIDGKCELCGQRSTGV